MANAFNALLGRAPADGEYKVRVSNGVPSYVTSPRVVRDVLYFAHPVVIPTNPVFTFVDGVFNFTTFTWTTFPTINLNIPPGPVEDDFFSNYENTFSADLNMLQTQFRDSSNNVIPGGSAWPTGATLAIDNTTNSLGLRTELNNAQAAINAGATITMTLHDDSNPRANSATYILTSIVDDTTAPTDTFLMTSTAAPTNVLGDIPDDGTPLVVQLNYTTTTTTLVPANRVSEFLIGEANRRGVKFTAIEDADGGDTTNIIYGTPSTVVTQ